MECCCVVEISEVPQHQPNEELLLYSLRSWGCFVIPHIIYWALYNIISGYCIPSCIVEIIIIWATRNQKLYSFNAQLVNIKYVEINIPINVEYYIQPPPQIFIYRRAFTHSLYTSPFTFCVANLIFNSLHINKI